MALQELQARELSAVHDVPKPREVPGDMERGGIPAHATGPLEGLEDARSVEDEYHLEGVWPCIATLYLGGVGSDREPYAWLLAHYFRIRHHLSVEAIAERVLPRFNSRLSRPLPASELAKYRRQLEAGRYAYHVRCHHPSLEWLCISPECPYEPRKSEEPPRCLIARFGYGQVLDTYAVWTFLVVCEAAISAGVKCGQVFNFAEDEVLSRIGSYKNRRTLQRSLEDCKRVGLLTHYRKGVPRTKGQQGRRSELVIARSIPRNPQSKYVCSERMQTYRGYAKELKPGGSPAPSPCSSRCSSPQDIQSVVRSEKSARPDSKAPGRDVLDAN